MAAGAATLVKPIRSFTAPVSIVGLPERLI
jgi:hypothetical protein